MKKLLRAAISLLGWLTLMPAATYAQTGSFSCDGTFYQIRQEGSTSRLFRVDRSATAYTTVPVNVNTINGLPTNDLGVVLNGLAYNAQDGYMYALSTTGTTATLPAANTITLYRIDQSSIVNLGTTNLPGIQVASGAIDKNGRYYVSSQNSTGTLNYNLYEFNLAAPLEADRRVAVARRLRNEGNTLDVNLTFYDIALNPKDDQLYGVQNTGTLWKINRATSATQAAVTAISATASAGSEAIGSAIFDIAGNLSVYSNGNVNTANSGKFYQVDLTSGAYTLISNLAPASVSDGASCINPAGNVDVVKQVTSVDRTGTAAGQAGREYIISFEFKVKNTGFQTLRKVQLSDFLWSGSGTTTQKGTVFSDLDANRASSVVVASTDLTVLNDGTATLAPNNTGPTPFTGVSTTAAPIQAGLLTGTQDLAAGQSATIKLTATVTYPSVASVPVTISNQAYASALTGATTANAGYRLAATTGTLFSPTNGTLQAIDNSTNSSALPVTPNADAPSPSPILYPITIAGNVFEDANYGGGAGRSKAASSGTGVLGARVELYSDAGGFLSATTTSAEGDYVFTTSTATTALAANTAYQVRVVNSTVPSTRPNPGAATVLAVQTFRTDTSTKEAATNLTDRVGGEQPNKADHLNITSGNLLAATAAREIQSLTKLLTLGSGPRAGLDFGFNFDAVVNTNTAGQGSLRQFILNSNALTNAGLAQVGRPAGTEYAIFMLNDGRAAALPGLQASMLPVTGYNATTRQFTIILATALPTISDSNTAIDGSLQTAFTGNNVAAVAETTTGPEVVIDFSTRAGLFVTGGNTRIASLGLTNAVGSSLNTTSASPRDGAAITFSTAAVTGSIVTDVTALSSVTAGVYLQSGATGVSITNNILNNGATNTNAVDGTIIDGAGIQLLSAASNTITGNVINGNKGFGVYLATTGSNNNTISGNIIRNNGSGGSSNDAGVAIGIGNNNQISANTITGNTGPGIVALRPTSGNRITRNSIANNGGLGIDLSATAVLTGDDVSKNANGKTAASGANGLLNFPVLVRASVTNPTGNVQVVGFAPAGSTLEIFLSDVTTPAFGEGQTYLFSALEGGSLLSPANGTTATITDNVATTGNYGGLINTLDQGSETGAQRFFFDIPLSSLTSAQRTALTTGTARLTATATAGSTTTSEFSGNVLVEQGKQLPVELTRFEATAQTTNTLLTWATASEKNNDHFDVERSANGTTFERVGIVKGSGSTTSAHEYSFVDAGAGRFGPKLYYRLRQVDTDGTEAFSPVRTVIFAPQRAQVMVYPNPAATITTLDLSTLPTGTYSATVIDMTGRTLLTQQVAGGLHEKLAVSQLPAGTYVIRIQGLNTNLTQRLVKQK